MRQMMSPSAFYTSGPISGGDSGGGVFDLDGRVVAIHTGGGRPPKSVRHARVELLRAQWNLLVEAKPVEGLSSTGLAEIREPFSEIAKPASPVVVRVQQQRSSLTREKPGKQPLDSQASFRDVGPTRARARCGSEQNTLRLGVLPSEGVPSEALPTASRCFVS